MSKLLCSRCNHEWITRIETPPVSCPKCKSIYWNKPRVRVRKLDNKEATHEKRAKATSRTDSTKIR